MYIHYIYIYNYKYILCTHAITNDLVKWSLHKGSWRIFFWLLWALFTYTAYIRALWTALWPSQSQTQLCGEVNDGVLKHNGNGLNHTSAIFKLSIGWQTSNGRKVPVLICLQNHSLKENTCECTIMYHCIIPSMSFYLDISERGISVKKMNFLPWHWWNSSKSKVSREIQEHRTV